MKAMSRCFRTRWGHRQWRMLHADSHRRFIFKTTILLVAGALVLLGCSNDAPTKVELAADYLDYTGRDDMLSGGVKMISVDTPKGTFQVWTKRVGNNAAMKVLLLYGGPGATHEYMEAFDSYFPTAGRPHQIHPGR